MINEQRQQRPLWLLTIAVFLGFLLPVLVTDGMFMDGLLYAVMSKNMAHDTGSLWKPYLTATLDTQFYDHPPLVFGIQSIFFNIFGDAFWVERFYSFLTAIFTVLLISVVWKRVVNNASYSRLAWLPVFFWLSIPLVHWSYVNNMLENTMTIFSMLAFLALYKSIQRNSISYLWQVPAALLLVCAFLSKGFTGLFPLAFYAIHWLVFRQFGFIAMLKYSILLLLISTLVFLPFMLYEPSAFAITSYLKQQVVKSVQGDRETIERTFILQKLSMELCIVIFFALLAWLIAKRRGISTRLYSPHSRFFLLTALSASLPIMISPKQSGFYALPSLPFFALSAALYAAPVVKSLTGRINTSRLSFKIVQAMLATAIVSIVAASVARFGKPGRDKDRLHDMYLVTKNVDQKTISICPSMQQDWGLHGYFMRYGEISLDWMNSREYFLSNGECPDSLSGYTELELPLKVYTLYKKSAP